MYNIKPAGQYKKDIKLCAKRNLDLSLMASAILKLMETGTLSVDEYGTHKLKGQKEETWDAHLAPDWVLLFRKYESYNDEYDGIVVLVRTGTHSDLFKK